MSGQNLALWVNGFGIGILLAVVLMEQFGARGMSLVLFACLLMTTVNVFMQLRRISTKIRAAVTIT